MQFLYEKEAGKELLVITDENFKYLSKVRRIQKEQEVVAKNLKDGFAYKYKVAAISKKELQLQLLSKTPVCQTLKKLHLGWCVVDFKSVEKTLPFLNELGVSKITFIYCDKSQKNYKPNFERMQKILINSCQQCGRESLMELQTCSCLTDFIDQNPQSYLCEFGGESITQQKIETVIVGPEGGFSECEKKLSLPKLGFNTPLILRSESAVTAIASKLLV